MNTAQRKARAKAIREAQGERTKLNRERAAVAAAAMAEEMAERRKLDEEARLRYEASLNTPVVKPEVCIPEVLPPETEGERAAKEVLGAVKLFGAMGWKIGF